MDELRLNPLRDMVYFPRCDDGKVKTQDAKMVEFHDGSFIRVLIRVSSETAAAKTSNSMDSRYSKQEVNLGLPD